MIFPGGVRSRPGVLGVSLVGWGLLATPAGYVTLLATRITDDLAPAFSCEVPHFVTSDAGGFPVLVHGGEVGAGPSVSWTGLLLVLRLSGGCWRRLSIRLRRVIWLGGSCILGLSGGGRLGLVLLGWGRLIEWLLGSLISWGTSRGSLATPSRIGEFLLLAPLDHVLEHLTLILEFQGDELQGLGDGGVDGRYPRFRTRGDGGD
jgi:hypothetical protein